MPTFNIPGVPKPVNFPDTMTQAEIDAAIMHDFPQAAAAVAAPTVAAEVSPAAKNIRAFFGAPADVGMGIGQTLGSAAQLIEHATDALIPAGNPIGDAIRTGSSAEDYNSWLRDKYTRYTDPESQPVASGLGRGVGQALSLIPAAPAVAAVSAPGLIGSAAGGSLSGVLSGLATPLYDTQRGDPNFWGNKGMQVGKDAAFGAVAGPAITLAGNALSPVLDKGVQLLRDAKIRLTPGQALGGFWNNLEEKIGGVIPGVGDLIRNRRFDSIKDFNVAKYNDALSPFGVEYQQLMPSGEVGRPGVKAVGDFLSKKYDAALDISGPATLDNQFKGDMAQLAMMVPDAHTGDFIKAINRTINDHVTPAGTITPSVARDAESELGRLFAQYKGSGSGNEREYAFALAQAQANLRSLMGRYNPEARAITDAANEGWKTIVQMERAAAGPGARDGIFTPAQYYSSTKAGDTTVRDRASGRGDAWGQDLTDAANRILPNKVPDSGTAGRLVAAGGAGALLHGFGFASPSMLAGTAAAATAYAPGVNQFLTKMVAGQRPLPLVTLADLLRSGAPYAGLAAPASSQLSGP